MRRDPGAGRSPGKLLGDVLRGQRWRVIGSALFLMSWQACESLVPVSIGVIIDQAITTGRVGRMWLWVAVLTAQFLVLSMSFRFGSRLARSASERASHRIRVQVAADMLDLSRVPDRAHHPGTVVSIAGSDADRVAALCAFVPRALSALVSVTVAAVVLLRISVLLGLVVLVGAPVLLSIVHLLGTPLERRSGTEQHRAARAAALATDLMAGLRVLKGFRGESAAAERYGAASQESKTATLRAARAESAYESATLLATMCFVAVVALVGGRLAAGGHIAVGDLVAAVGLAQFLIGPLSGLSTTGAALARARASAERVLQALDAPRRPVSGTPVPSHAAGRDLVVRHAELDLRVGPGELVGLVAEPAVAAALVDRLATSTYAEQSGVSVAGVAAGTADLRDWASAVRVARHDDVLFAESLGDNVRAGGRDDAAVVAAMRAADADQVAETLPGGVTAMLGERGRTLSGGQRQRVALARALAADSDVLVLHDPTTAVDAATEERIASGLAELRQGRTTLVVATSPALLAVCDRVVHITGNGVVASGSHGDLMATDVGYRERVRA